MPLIQSPLRISLSFSIEHSVQMCIHAVWAEWYLECKTTTVDLAHLRESNSHLIKIILTFTQQFDWIIPDQFMNAVVFMTDNSFMEKKSVPKESHCMRLQWIWQLYLSWKDFACFMRRNKLNWIFNRFDVCTFYQLCSKDSCNSTMIISSKFSADT